MRTGMCVENRNVSGKFIFIRGLYFAGQNEEQVRKAGARCVANMLAAQAFFSTRLLFFSLLSLSFFHLF